MSNTRHSLKKLGNEIPRRDFEEAFGEYYSEEGRPAKPVRLMVGLLLLKQMYDQSDEEVVERWVENPYWQQFCGMSDFQWELPCEKERDLSAGHLDTKQYRKIIMRCWKLADKSGSG